MKKANKQILKFVQKAQLKLFFNLHQPMLFLIEYNNPAKMYIERKSTTKIRPFLQRKDVVFPSQSRALRIVLF